MDPRMQGPIRTVELTAHQPLVIAGQALMADWRLQARVKFLLLNEPTRKEKVSSSIAA